MLECNIELDAPMGDMFGLRAGQTASATASCTICLRTEGYTLASLIFRRFCIYLTKARFAQSLVH